MKDTPVIWQPESKPFWRNRKLDRLLNDVMQVFPPLNVPIGPRTEEFSEEVVFPAFKTSAWCSVHGNENGRLQGRFLLLTRRQSIRLGWIIWSKIAFNAWLLEPNVNSNNGHSNCHSHSRWRRADRFCYRRVHSLYICMLQNYSFHHPANWTKRLASYIIILLLQ